MVGWCRETNEKHDEYGVEEEFQLTRRKFDRDGEGDRETEGKGYGSVNI